MLTWHIARTAPLTELRVRAGLRERGFSAYLPLERRWKSVRGKPSEAADYPMFPGYLFIGTTEKRRHELEKVKGLLGLVPTAWPADRMASLVYDMTIRQLAGDFDRTGQSRVSLKPLVGPMDTSLGHGLEALSALLATDARGRIDLVFPSQSADAA